MTFGRNFFSRFLPSVRSSHSPAISGGGAAASTQILGIHVLHCPDVVGIVSRLSECISMRGANIHSVDVFVPEIKKIFYSRSEFVFDPTNWPRDLMNNDFTNIGKSFKAERSIVRVPALDPKYKISILASKQVRIRTIVWWMFYMGGRMIDFPWI